jgi:hypothetical protein
MTVNQANQVNAETSTFEFSFTGNTVRGAREAVAA